MKRSLILTIFFLLVAKNLTAPKLLICNSTFSNVSGVLVEWPSTYDRTPSKPLCLTENKEFVFRGCKYGTWAPEPTCEYLQPEVLPQCPEDFFDAGDLCIQLSPKSAFPPKCPFEDVALFHSYKNIFDSFKNTSQEFQEPIWVPAKRTDLGFMEWIEPSGLYRVEVDGYSTLKPVKDKNCLIYSEGNFTTVSCLEEYRGVCAYKKLDQITDTLCDSLFDCVQSDFSTRSKCFCRSNIRLLHSSYPKAEFLKPYQASLYKRLTNDVCGIGLMKVDGKYLWTTSNQEITYTFWSPNVSFDDDDDIYGAVTSNGWILRQYPPDCSIFQTDIVNLRPSLRLEFNSSDSTFNLIVTNPTKVKTLDCFVNNDRVRLLMNDESIIVSGDHKGAAKYRFQTGSMKTSGYYWCEAFKQIDLGIIKTDSYLYKTSGYLEFVGIFQVEYPTDINPLSKDIISFMENILFVYVFDSHTSKIMKIIDLDEESQKITLNIHFTYKMEVSSDDVGMRQYLNLSNFLSNFLSESKTDIQLIDFLSADFCVSEQDYVTWPKSAIDSIVTSSEFCFTPDGIPVSRVCGGDFMDGAQWSSFEECEIFGKSSLTNDLLEADHQNSSLYSIEKMLNVSKKYDEITPVDVYLIGKLYSEFLFSPEVDNLAVELFAKTVNNLLNVDIDVLAEAQLKLGATDKLLYFIDQVISCETKGFNNTFDNFVLLSFASRDVSGIIVQRIDDKFNVTELVGDHTPKDIAKIENLESAIWLSSDLRKKLKDEDRITFSVYFDDSFFTQPEVVQTSIIFGLVSPKTWTFFPGPVQMIHKVNSYRHSNYYCAFWGYTLELRGTWKSHGKADSSSSFLLCEFWHEANYALITSDTSTGNNSNVTDDLKNLLQSNSSAPETMEQLSHISEKYRHFEAVDVTYVGKILEKVSDNDGVDLHFLAQTVNNVQEVKREVLLQSQMEGGATDTILTHVDAIIQNHQENQIQVNTDYFLIVVVDLKDDFTGLVLHQSTSLEPEVLKGNVSLDEMVDKDDFDSAIVLSPELKLQLGLEGKIVITIYSSDALFNEESPKQKFVSKIFGVVLPETGTFKGPVSVLHKTNKSEDQRCAYWHYQVHNISGSWKQDGQIGNIFKVLQCDFWHTTHFAYLIMDEERIDTNSSALCDILEVLTTVNCGISLVCLLGILLTAVFFSQWRENTGNKILINFSLVIILQIVVFYISTTVSGQDYLFCTIIGVLLHYSMISQFCWMFVVAILQFRRFVTVLEGPPSFVLLKACACGWILPLLPVACVFVLDNENYVKSHVGLCYPSGFGLYLGVWLPICVIILINFVIFSITLYSIVHKRARCVSVGSYDAFYQWRLALLLFFMLGFTWSFGFLAELKSGLVFEYLFCMTATLQGFILFLFFILLNANTRYLYSSAIGRCCKRKFR